MSELLGGSKENIPNRNYLNHIPLMENWKDSETEKSTNERRLIHTALLLVYLWFRLQDDFSVVLKARYHSLLKELDIFRVHPEVVMLFKEIHRGSHRVLASHYVHDDFGRLCGTRFWRRQLLQSQNSLHLNLVEGFPGRETDFVHALGVGNSQSRPLTTCKKRHFDIDLAFAT